MEENLITFDTAVLAKKRDFGINESSYHIFDPQGNPITLKNQQTNTTLEGGYCLRTSQALLEKWIRKYYKLHISIMPTIHQRFQAEVYKLNQDKAKFKLEPIFTWGTDNPEQTLEITLYYILLNYDKVF